MEYVTVDLLEEDFQKLYHLYEEEQLPISEDYVIFYAKHEDIFIKVYERNDGSRKVFYAGEHAEMEARILFPEATKKEKKEKIKAEWLSLDDQIGSDEVGVGDFFGPTIVVASFVKASQIPFLRELGVNDSKKLTDEKICEIAPKLLEVIPYSLLCMRNEKLNEMLDKGEKKLHLEARMHNQAQKNVYQKVGEYAPVYIDQFLSAGTYLSAIGKQKIDLPLVFQTKGESFYPSIAVSSIIARYALLKEMEMLDQTYQMHFPFGAGKKVDEVALAFIEKYGVDELSRIVKKQFVNYTKIITK